MADSFKFSTFIFLVLGLIVPLWPISLPLFWWLAYRSYKNGNPVQTSLVEVEKAASLLSSGIISQQEFDKIKLKAGLGR